MDDNVIDKTSNGYFRGTSLFIIDWTMTHSDYYFYIKKVST